MQNSTGCHEKNIQCVSVNFSKKQGVAFKNDTVAFLK